MLKYIVSIITLVFLFSCSKEEKKVEVKSTIPQSYPSISLNVEQLKLMDIQLQMMEDKLIYPIVYANGIVAPQPNHDAALTPRIAGVIDEIFVLEGSNVQKGQAIMSMSSTELIELQQSYMTALSEANFNKKEFERQTTLRNSNVGALSEYQLIESHYQNAVSLEKTLRAKLSIQGLNADDLSDPANAKIKTEKIIRAPISGYIHNMPARIGMRAEPSTVLAEVIDLSELRADVFCYEKDLALVKENQIIEIQFVNKAIPPVKGKIEFVSRTIDKTTRSIVMHTSFKAPKGYLVLPEMSITAKIQGLNAGKIKKTVPQAALYDNGNQFYIFYSTTADTAKTMVFRKAKVTPGTSDGKYSEIDFDEIVPFACKIAVSNVANLESEFKKQGN
ncbi:MAG: efflux RND transporter periplasmic adaptor subunit [Cytophagales bacterium]